MLPRIRVSLANKCQLLFGAAVLVLLTGALSVVAWRMQTLVHQGPIDRAAGIAEAYLAALRAAGTEPLPPGVVRLTGDLGPPPPIRADDPDPAADLDSASVRVGYLPVGELAGEDRGDAFLAAAVARMTGPGAVEEASTTARDSSGETYYRYALAVRLTPTPPPARSSTARNDDTEPIPDALLLVHLRDDSTAAESGINTIYLIAAGLFAALLAILTFWFITTRIILSPVRTLRRYAQRVSEGDLNVRSAIHTGDEYEQLSDVFNRMISSLKISQDELRQINRSLDMKLGELHETNVALFEADKMKGEFLANVSHEFRTPLNSIIGFAEVLEETLIDRTGPIDEKRKRYVANIITGAKRLLELINDLLDLVKIEAGRMELRTSPVSIRDTLEGLITLMKPQANKRSIALRLRCDPRLPLVETDVGRLQQILFNLLSNAIKFSPDGGQVTLSAVGLPAEVVPVVKVGPDEAAADAEPPHNDDEAPLPMPPDTTPTSTPTPAPAPPSNYHGNDTPTARVRLSVTDTGPGIAPEDHDRIFDKFTQLDPTATRRHGGTGLGLTISRELATMLQGRLEVESTPGRGATFSLTLPVTLADRSAPLMPAVGAELGVGR